MTAPAKRGRGRPKGSKNKRRNLSQANVQEICDFHKFNAAEKLIRIATDSDFDAQGQKIEWEQNHKFRATEKLFEAVHGKGRLPGAEIEGAEIDGQYAIVFEELPGDFQLPGTADAAGAEEALPAESVQRAGDTPPGG